MIVFVQRIHTHNTKYADFKYKVIADWEQAPLFRMQDALSMNWSDDFTLYSSSIRTAYQSLGLKEGKTSMIHSSHEKGIAY